MYFTSKTEAMISVPFKYVWNFTPEELEKMKNVKSDKDNQICLRTIIGPDNFKYIKIGLMISRTRSDDDDDDDVSDESGKVNYIVNLWSRVDDKAQICQIDLKYKLTFVQTSKAPVVIKIDKYETLFDEETNYVTNLWNFDISSIECEFKIKIPYKHEMDALTEDFSLLRLNAQFADVTLVVGEKEFAAHKAILSARSSVFATMFGNEKFVENQTNRVEIGDIAPEVFEVLLNFIYTSKIIREIDYYELVDLYVELVKATHLYDIKSLLPVCVELLIDELGGNEVRFLLLSKTYDLVDLRKKAIDRINRNAKQVTSSEDFIKHVKPDHSLMEELYADLVEKHPQTNVI